MRIGWLIRLESILGVAPFAKMERAPIGRRKRGYTARGMATSTAMDKLEGLQRVLVDV